MMAARKPETRLQRRIREKLEAEFPGSWWTKIHGNEFQRAGLPDLIGCVNGFFFGFEVKVIGETASELQRYEIECIRKANGTASIVHNAQEAIDLVRKAFTRAARRC